MEQNSKLGSRIKTLIAIVISTTFVVAMPMAQASRGHYEETAIPSDAYRTFFGFPSVPLEMFRGRNPQYYRGPIDTPVMPKPAAQPKPKTQPKQQTTISPRPTKSARNSTTRGSFSSARLTAYNPNPSSYRSKREARLEGGKHTRFGAETLNSVENSIRNGRPVSIAADYTGAFGKQCNQRNQRCLIAFYVEGFDELFPGYRRKFSYLPKDWFLGIVEDTGGAFVGKGSKRFDVAIERRSLSFGVTAGFNRARWVRVANPCGDNARARYCDLSNLRVAELSQRQFASRR